MEENFIDSSVLVALFNEQDSQHAKALKGMEAALKPLLVHEYVVLETSTVLMHKADKNLADIFLQGLLENADFRVVFSSESNFFLTVKTFLENKTSLSFTDAMLLEFSSSHSILTFDSALERAIGKQRK